MSTDNIVVAIKSRPLIEREKNGPQWVIKDKFIYQADRLTDPYTFDYIYNETYTNEAVYNDIVKPLVHSCLSGFNATVFAYGQTSSGKTHTIMGNETDMGVVALAINDIFKYVASNSSRQYLIRCSFYELYNEKLYDLLHLPIRPIRIREDSQGNITVDADEAVVNSSNELMDVMFQGSKNKKMACTKMNTNSSRSHTIFRIMIESKEISSNNLSVQVSQLNFVDLAGSERLAQTESTGIRLTEGVNINKSLLVLGSVIRQLCENESFVSYRDSKLTRILKASLGGNAKCLVIAAITVAAIEETKSTLEFAQRAKKVKNKPTINEITSNETQKQVELQYANRLKSYRQKILELENELNLFRKKESDVKAVMSFKSNLTTPIINRRHTICAVKDTYARCTYPIGTDKQFFKSNVEGCHVLETIPKKQEYISTAPTSDINIADLDTGQELIEASYLYEEKGKKISSQIKKLGHHILEPISESEEYINTSISDTNIAIDTSQDGIKTCSRHEEKVFSQNESIDCSIEGDLCDGDKSYLDASPLSTNSTPKSTLRENLAILAEDYEELQQFTSYESMYSKDKDVQDLLAKIKRYEEEVIALKKCIAEGTSLKWQQLQKNDEQSKRDIVLKDNNELKHIQKGDSEKQINNVFDFNVTSSENENYIEELNTINLVLNQQPEGDDEIIYYIRQQLLKLKSILEKPSAVHTREVQTDIFQTTHTAVQTQHGVYSTNNTQSQSGNKQQSEEIVHMSVCTQTENDTDLLQITYTTVQEKSQKISTSDVDTQTENETIDVLIDLLQVNHTAVQTEYQGFSTNSTQTEYDFICTQSENDLETPPLVQCVLVQTDSLPMHYAAIQTEVTTQTIEITHTSVHVQTETDRKTLPSVQCVQLQTDSLPIHHAAIQTENKIQKESKTQTMEIAHASACVQTENDLEKLPTVRCMQMQTDLLQMDHTAVQTEYQEILTNGIQEKNETPTEETQYRSFCTQTESDLETPSSVQCVQLQTDSLPIHHTAIQTENKIQKESKTQTMEIAHASACVQTENDLEKLPTVRCMQMQTDLLQMDHTAVQTEYQEILTNGIQEENETPTEETHYRSFCTQTESDLETPSSVQCVQLQTDSLPIHHAAIQTENKIQKESKTQTMEIAHASACVQTENDLEKLPTVRCMQMQTDLLQMDHTAVQTEYQEISTNGIQEENGTPTEETHNCSISTQTESDLETPPSVQCVQLQTDSLPIQTENKTQKESKTQTMKIDYTSACVQTENGEGRLPTVRFIGMQTDMLLTNHIATARRISTEAPRRDLTQEGEGGLNSCTRTINALGNLHNEKKWQKFKAVEQHVGTTNSPVDVSPIEKRKQKLHEIYDSNRRISSEFSKEDMEIFQEDLSRYQKEKEEELWKLNKELAKLKDENAILNDEVEYFMNENEELRTCINQLEIQKKMEENKKCIKCDDQEISLKVKKKWIGEKPYDQKHCTDCKLLSKQLQLMKTNMAVNAKQIFELLNSERENQQQIEILQYRHRTLSDENRELKGKNELLKVKYTEVKNTLRDLKGT